jgi:hypothetical protein
MTIMVVEDIEAEQVDVNNAFALTIHINSLRMLMAIMVVEDMEAEQVDVNNAFTKSKL